MSALAERSEPARPVSRLLSVAQVCERLGNSSDDHVYRLIARGELFSVKSGRRRLIPEEAVDQYIAALKAEAEA